MQPTTRQAQTQLVLLVAAIAIGAVVFALAGDFIIGVAVGAGVFALARQAMKARGPRGDDDASALDEPDCEPTHRSPGNDGPIPAQPRGSDAGVQ